MKESNPSFRPELVAPAPSVAQHQGLARYVEFYERIDAANVEELLQMVTHDVHFRDPFNEYRDAQKMLAAFRDMFHQCSNPRFKMLHVSHDAARAFLKWDFSFTPKSSFFNSGRPVSFVGLSEVVIQDDGLVCEHLDYWDAAREFHERIPLLGVVLRGIRGRLAV